MQATAYPHLSMTVQETGALQTQHNALVGHSTMVMERDASITPSIVYLPPLMMALIESVLPTPPIALLSSSMMDQIQLASTMPATALPDTSMTVRMQGVQITPLNAFLHLSAMALEQPAF